MNPKTRDHVILAILIVAASALAAIRISGETGQFFQALAHLIVGGLFGAFFAERRPAYLWLALGLSLVELACFLLGVGEGSS